MSEELQGHPLRSAIAREWARLRADHWDMAMLTAIPLALIVFAWWIFSSGIPRDLPLVIVDRDHSVMSRTLARMLEQSPGLHVADSVNSEAEAIALLRRREAFGIVFIPADMQRDISGARSVKVQWAYNAQFPSYTGSMTRDVRTVVTTMSVGIELQARAKRGSASVQAKELYEPIRTRATSLYNENGSYEPALALPVAFSLLHIFVTLAAVTAVGRELRMATVPQWLASARGNVAAALAAKLAIPLLAFAVHTALIVILFGALRGWAVAGSVLALGLGTLCFITAYLAMGAFLAAATGSLRAALSACAFITAPAFAFTGQGFPILAMPLAARVWAESLPLTHYLPLLNRTWIAGAPLRYGIGDIAVLLAFTVVFGGLAYLFLLRRVKQPDSWGKT
ncbi:ABC transporter permease [Massilia sp. CF038]|uniref:ABC transporter permease n=1 Tax=Massilia sp. CF038 TaxID=1881045 RepID=UPI000915BD94|nr:ABC transporter permease [Massilia sp. CF038]SHH19392.1 ABC-2 type transport system permease protein [Massilia sp. CF038]